MYDFLAKAMVIFYEFELLLYHTYMHLDSLTMYLLEFGLFTRAGVVL